MFSKNPLLQKQSANFSELACLIIPENAQVVAYPNPVGKSYQAFKKPIVKKAPCFDDIRQGSSGDCFLLAALFSIVALADGASIITGMFQAKGDHIIVRLFDREGKPHYLSLEKSLPVKWNGPSSRAPWVQFIEKAYAAFKLDNYSALNGGSPDEAILTLTGARYEGFCTLPLQSRQSLSLITEYVNADGIYLFHELMRINTKTPPAIRNRLLKVIFANDLASFSQWETWLNRNNRAVDWQQLLLKIHPIEWQHVEQFINGYQTENECQPVLTQIKHWLSVEKILPGAPLSAQYSYEELSLFDEIKKQLANQRAIFVSAHSDVLSQRYISSWHSYSVQGIEESTVLSHKYVLVRTPAPHFLHRAPKWMSYFFKTGRSVKEIDVQHQQSPQIEITQSQEVGKAYRMELSDFCRSFDTMKSTQPISSTAVDERVSAHLSVKK